MCFLDSLDSSYQGWKDQLLRHYISHLTQDVVDTKGKFAPRAWAGTLVGYEARNQWRVFDGTKVWIRRDVIFDESRLPYKSNRPAEAVGEDVSINLEQLISRWKPNQ